MTLLIPDRILPQKIIICSLFTVEVDGYYIESVICIIFGFLYLILWGWNTVKTLQNANEKDWRVINRLRQ